MEFTDPKDGKRKRLWPRRNLWIGRNYFYDADAVRVPGNEQHKNLKSEYRPIHEKALGDDAPGGMRRANRERPCRSCNAKKGNRILPVAI